MIFIFSESKLAICEVRQMLKNKNLCAQANYIATNIFSFSTFNRLENIAWIWIC